MHTVGQGLRRTVPVILNVIEIQLEDGPQALVDPCSVPVLDQPVSVKNESSGSQSWTIPLWPTYVYLKPERSTEPSECVNIPQQPVKADSSM